MTRKLDLAGLRFGRLLVLSEYGKLYNSVAWNCECECGKGKVVRSGHLASGAVRSCGCGQGDGSKRRHKQFRQRSFLRAVAGGYKTAARRRGLSWQLTEEQAHGFLLGRCVYCGNVGTQTRKRWPEFSCNGIDRIDNRYGYVAGNVASCCMQCNLSKNDYSFAEFIAWIDRVHGHLHG